jgi:hypothetical protein
VKRLALLLLLFAAVASADVVWKHAGVTKGPVTSVSCMADGGLLCTRDAGMLGTVQCLSATSTEPGCVTPSDQTWAGKKTLTDRERIVCKAHASLTACSAGEKGTWQSCCDHNAAVYCDGTTNLEFNGPAATEQVLGSVYVNGIPTVLMGSNFTLQSAATVTAIEGSWFSGNGSTVTIRLSDGTNNCDCAVSCAAPTTRTTCAGTCAFAAGVSIATSRQSDGCSPNPYVGGNLLVKGTTP